MFPMTITVHNAAQLNAALMALRPLLAKTDFADLAVGAAYEEAAARVSAAEKAALLEQPAPEVAAPAGKPTPAESAPDKPARGRRTAAVAAADAPEPSTEQPAPPASTEPTAAASSAPERADYDDSVTYEQVAAAVLAIVRAKGRDAAVAELKALGVSKAPELKPEQYEAALQALEAALEA